MYGNYDASKAANLMVAFEVCNRTDPGLKCKSDEEIKEWMKTKYILILMNERKFVQHKFEDEKILQHSFFKWYSLTPGARTDYINFVVRSLVELSDYIWNIGNLDAVKVDGFHFEKQPNRVISNQSLIQTAITFEMSYTQKKYFRRVYTVFDFLADVGGLFGSIYPICQGLVIFMQYHGSYLFIMQDLYAKGEEEEGSESKNEDTDER